MCGIFGWTIKHGSKLIAPEQLGIMAHVLARNNDSRGGDSWGFAAFARKQIHIERGLKKMAPNSFRLSRYRHLMGHCRYKTHGEPTIPNAHPFEIGDIIGSHNGVLSNHYDLNKTYGRNYDVDSMHLFAHLNENLPFSDISGYGSVEWIDKNDNTIYLCRLQGGELAIYAIGTKENIEGVVWSSREDHLKDALICAEISKYFEYEVQIGQVYFVKDSGLWRTDRKLELKSYTPNWRNYGGESEYYSGHYSYQRGHQHRNWQPPYKKNNDAIPQIEPTVVASSLEAVSKNGVILLSHQKEKEEEDTKTVVISSGEFHTEDEEASEEDKDMLAEAQASGNWDAWNKAILALEEDGTEEEYLQLRNLVRQVQ